MPGQDLVVLSWSPKVAGPDPTAAALNRLRSHGYELLPVTSTAGPGGLVTHYYHLFKGASAAGGSDAP